MRAPRLGCPFNSRQHIRGVYLIGVIVNRQSRYLQHRDDEAVNQDIPRVRFGGRESCMKMSTSTLTTTYSVTAA